MINYTIKLNFIRRILGSQPANEELKTNYIHKKMITGRTGMGADIAMDKIKDEIENLKADEKYQENIEEINDKALTVFFRNKSKQICLSDIQIRGFFKDNFAFEGRQNKWLSKKSGDTFSTDAPFRDYIGSRIMFESEYHPFEIQPESVGIYQRPIRVQTMQGPRVSITASEYIEAPNSITFKMVTTDDVKKEWVTTILERGMFRGLGQFSNAQFGTFTYEIL